MTTPKDIMIGALAAAAAEKFFEAVQEIAATTDGPHYAPCFRDCLGDNRAWVEPILAALLITAMTGKEPNIEELLK